MSENEKKILKTIAEALPKMSKEEQQYFLGYGDAVIALRKNNNIAETTSGQAS